MSTYLVIYKDDVCLGAWSRSSAFYDVFNRGAPTSNKEEFDLPDVCRYAHESLKDILDNYNESIQLYQRVLEGLTDYDARYDVVRDLMETERAKREYEAVAYMIDFLECTYDVEDNPNEHHWTWQIG